MPVIGPSSSCYPFFKWNIGILKLVSNQIPFTSAIKVLLPCKFNAEVINSAIIGPANNFQWGEGVGRGCGGS